MIHRRMSLLIKALALLLTVFIGLTWAETPSGKRTPSAGRLSEAVPKAQTTMSALPPLMLPEVTVAGFAEIPPGTNPSVTAALKDRATTWDKATNRDHALNFLGVRLTKAQQDFLNEEKFLLIPERSIRAELRMEPPGCVDDPWDEMLILFDMVSGTWSAMERAPENAHFVNPDVVLHAFHKYFDNSLKYLEKNDLAILLRSFVRDMQVKASDYSRTSDRTVAEHYSLIAAQFTVPLILIENAQWGEKSGREDDEAIDTFANAKKLLSKFQDGFSQEMLAKIENELQSIYDAQRMSLSPLFSQYAKNKSLQTDYTQFRPRGHYATHSVLRAYFRTMMYLGRNGYLFQTDEGVVDAMLVAYLLASPGKDGRPMIDPWQKIMEITGFYAGQSDDISYPEWREFLVKTLGAEEFAPTEAVRAETIQKLSKEMHKLRRPSILSDAIVDQSVLRKTKEQLLDETKAFRVFGQRFALDGWILDHLTAGDEKTESPLPSLASALFIPAALGDETAQNSVNRYLEQYHPPFSKDDIAKFSRRMAGIGQNLGRLDDTIWFGSLGSAWLKVLGNLTGTFGKGYPWYMQSKLFPAKQLESFLGSYTELKHDTLLYVKQPYAEKGDGGDEGTPPPVPKGFVEPNLPFWSGLQRLVAYAYAGFAEHGLFESEREQYGRLSRFKEQVDFYAMLAKKELLGEEITSDEYERLRTYQLGYMAQPFEPAAEFDEKDRRSALIADIQTDAAKTNQIVYEATGEPYLMLVLVGNENAPRLAVGVAFNHYEFTNPLAVRLGDEDWQKRVYESPGELPTKKFWYQGLMVK
ncbi:MAG: DUF3160 domain-containing protein [Desulfomonilaceae bacterium]